MALPTRRAQSPGGSIAERSDPLHEFENLQSRMERLMESVWSGSDIGNGGIWVPLAPGRSRNASARASCAAALAAPAGSSTG